VIGALLADMSQPEMWTLGCVLMGTLLSGGALAVSWYSVTHKVPVKLSPDPVRVQVTEAQHQQFASREAFEKLTADNTRRHAQLFAEIDKVTEDTRKNVEAAVREINQDRTRTMEKLNTEFIFIRENLAEIRTNVSHLQKDKK